MNNIQAQSRVKLFSKINCMEYSLLFILISMILRLFCMSSNYLLVEEAYYWNYANHFDFSYLDHPPMVAYLIKVSTLLLGTHEYSVRIPAMLCWVLTSFFSFKLAQLINRGTGWYAVMFLSILPFFFLQSLAMTPDMPLLACWSASLYSLYRALVKNEKTAWYIAGIWLGLGMLSKYSIVLLGPATLLYMCITPNARSWFLRKEPYLCALIAILLFTPVIYWNANHEWASFVFQGARRFTAEYKFTFHMFIGLLILFLMPLGVLSLWELCKKNSPINKVVEASSKRFFQIFTLFPLLFFGAFSLNHSIRFDWIGPILLAIIPWQIAVYQQAILSTKYIIRNGWLITTACLFLCYGLMITILISGYPAQLHKKVFNRLIAWDAITLSFNEVAQQVEQETHSKPIFVPLDLYNLASELSFYQRKLMINKQINQEYPVIGRSIFGIDSLMYNYWSKNTNLSGKTLILISRDLKDFNSVVQSHVTEISPMKTIWSLNTGLNLKVEPYYYKVVKWSV